MPKYMYQVIDENGNAKQKVELEHGMNEPMTTHPETGEKLVRVYTAFGINGAPKKSSVGLGEIPEGSVVEGEESLYVALTVIDNVELGDGVVAPALIAGKFTKKTYGSPLPGYSADIDTGLN